MSSQICHRSCLRIQQVLYGKFTIGWRRPIDVGKHGVELISVREVTHDLANNPVNAFHFPHFLVRFLPGSVLTFQTPDIYDVAVLVYALFTDPLAQHGLLLKHRYLGGELTPRRHLLAFLNFEAHRTMIPTPTRIRAYYEPFAAPR